MGLARALCEDSRVKALLLQGPAGHVRGRLGARDAESLALTRLESRFGAVTSEMVESLERAIDEVDAQVELPSAFLVPGGSAGSGALDLARSLVREAERRVVALGTDEIPNPHVLRYLNRPFGPAVHACPAGGQGPAVRLYERGLADCGRRLPGLLSGTLSSTKRVIVVSEGHPSIGSGRVLRLPT